MCVCIYIYIYVSTNILVIYILERGCLLLHRGPGRAEEGDEGRQHTSLHHLHLCIRLPRSVFVL